MNFLMHKTPESGIWMPILERVGVYTNDEKDYVFEDKTEKPEGLRIFHRVMVHPMPLGQFWNPDKNFLMFNLDEEKTMVIEMDVRALGYDSYKWGYIEDLEATLMIIKEDGAKWRFIIKDASNWTGPESSGKLYKLGEEKSEMEKSYKNQT